MKNIYILVCLILSSIFFVSCGKQKSQKTKVTISFEKSKLNKAWGLSSPASSATEYNCFGVFVRVPELSPISGCDDSSYNLVTELDIAAGTVALGGNLTVEVESGPGRIFQVVGWKSSSTCPDFYQDIQSIETTLSPPAILGQTTADLFAATESVSITADIVNKKEFEYCYGPAFGNLGDIPFSGSFYYPDKFGYYEQGVAITSLLPTYSGFSPTSFSISPDINTQTGLTFNTSTGEISGTPSLTNALTTYTVTASDGVRSEVTKVLIKVNTAGGYYYVDSVGDGGDDNSGVDAICDNATDGGCTLRAAIETNNAGSFVKDIIIPDNTYILLGTVLNIQGNTFDILGKDPNTVILDGQDATPIMNISIAGTINVAGVGFQDGYNSSTSGGAFEYAVASTVVKFYGVNFISNRCDFGGGAIGITYTTTVFECDDCYFFQNSTSHATQGGGAIYNTGATSMLISNSVIEGNSADGATASGGAIFHNAGTFGLMDSYIVDNDNFTGTGDGGAIYIGASATGFDADFNTFELNLAGNDGGAIADLGGLTYELANNTFYLNLAANTGGHIFIDNASANVNLLNNTFVAGDAGPVNGGGALAIGGAGGVLSLLNNIFQENLSNTADMDDCLAGSGTINANANNFSDTSDADCSYSGADLYPADANLGPISFMGNLGPVFVPYADSLAIDAGSGCPGQDQRHLSRPVGAACDIGAIEFSN